MQGKYKFVIHIRMVDENKSKGNARKIQICIGLMEELNKNKNKENARKMQICIGLMER